jgi:hypothetical protein
MDDRGYLKFKGNSSKFLLPAEEQLHSVDFNGI